MSNGWNDAVAIKSLVDGTKTKLCRQQMERLAGLGMISLGTRTITRSDGKICLIPKACPSPAGIEIAKNYYPLLGMLNIIRRCLMRLKYETKR